MYGLNYFSIFIIKDIFASNYINRNYECNNFDVDQSKSFLFAGTTTNLESQNVNQNIKNNSCCNSSNFLIDTLGNESNNFKNHKEYNNIEHFNKSLQINRAFNVKNNKRKIDDNEQIDLNTKYICLERNPYIYNTNTSYLYYHGKSSNYSISNFESNIRRLVCLKSFNYIFRIISNDLINILRIAVNFSILENEYILPIISILENIQFNEQKIIYFMNITNEILKKEVNYKTYSIDRHNLIDDILYTKYNKNHNKKRFEAKLYNKTLQIDFYMKKNTLSYDDILYVTINYLNKTTDKLIHYIFLCGFQSLFNSFSKNSISKLCFVLTFLYTYNEESRFYDVEWYVKMFKMLSLSYFNVRNSNQCYKILNQEYEMDSKKTFYVYMAINLENNKFKIKNFKDVHNNKQHLRFVNYLIEQVNKIKCKLFGIRFLD
ncbi:hypothetical protein NAPIS_ORF00274 [Vairimorpha apis BRL 01]|uniref:Uncharacterized protein n=1 Tax=Vairimorpha apis BRL 01 TaxID=1037528 RepID=T0LCW6_9MICR|nr:hypothetical protein NAPIS_ORF00274 [Vairimorpha apis BRL 01]